MTSVTEILCAIERRADRAIVQELRLMTQEILAMRTHLSLEQRAHADALLLKLDHLQHCQQVETVSPPPTATDGAPAVQDRPVLALDTLTPLQPGHYLVHFYSHDVGDLERVELTETLAAAAQLVRQHLSERARPVWHVNRDVGGGEFTFLTGDDMVLASILPCEPSDPEVEPSVAAACAALMAGDAQALRRLFVSTAPVRPARLVA